LIAVMEKAMLENSIYWKKYFEDKRRSSGGLV